MARGGVESSLTWADNSVGEAHEENQGEGEHNVRQQVQPEGKPLHGGDVMEPRSRVIVDERQVRIGEAVAVFESSDDCGSCERLCEMMKDRRPLNSRQAGEFSCSRRVVLLWGQKPEVEGGKKKLETIHRNWNLPA